MNAPNESALRLWIRPLLVWLALLILLGITLGGAYVPLGPFNTVLSLGIAALKAGLIFIFFMHLWRSSALLRLGALSGLLWLVFMFSLTFADYFTRPWNGGGTSLARHSEQVTGQGAQRLPLDERR